MIDATRKMNEADVREDVAMPLLRALGYAAGTANDIIREKALEYPNNFLGRKKKADPPLRGRADYILTVLGAGSWTLEIKAEEVEIDRDAIEQAITYARHPQVSGSYAAVLNGRRFVAFHNTQRSDEPLLIDLPVAEITELAKALENTLSPHAVRQNCSPPKVDLEMPLAAGLRSSATISKASILYDRFSWRSNIPVPKEAVATLDESCRRMSGLRVSASGGWIKRDERSRITAKLEWLFPNDDLRKFAEQKQIADMEYVCLTSTLSEDPLKPTIFHIVGKIDIEAGDSLFDMATWRTKIAGIDAVLAYGGQATGFLEAGIFQGTVEAKYEITFPTMPALRIIQSGFGKLELSILR
ncbi:type I restriction enzyme HsdR N-terminal domain-containing protein [Bradyrhizobium lablabi]|nr:type I restriction enzyme HsdR N-terminal domain-containing protein [Bradyrhizobium lablabi]